MARMSSNAEIPRRDFGDSSQLTNWILDSGATCNTAPHISYCIPGSLAETDKYIKVSYGHFSQQNKQDKSKSKCATIMAKPSLIRYIA